jgi:hypothetical protein
LFDSFLQKNDYPPEHGDREVLLNGFNVPVFVANRACTELNGYFGCRATYDEQNKVTACSRLSPPLFFSPLSSMLRDPGTWFRCLVKMVSKVKEDSHEEEAEYVTDKKDEKGYIWFEMGIFTRWDDGAKCKVLCVNTPNDLPKKLEAALGKRPSHLDFRDPFAMHTDLLDQIIVYYEISIWRVRDPIRMLEEVSMQRSYG